MSALALTLVSMLAHAAEPRFCDPAKIKEYERANPVRSLKRAHVYQFGKLTLAGLAVGNSDYHDVQALAKHFGVQDGKSCTWYYNTGNDNASVAFNFLPLPRPWLRSSSIAKEYAVKLDGAFDRSPRNMLKCAREENFVAMGCDGMKHRGPSVFAALLSYAGCTPEHSMQIANKIWGTNFVAKSTRKAIAAVGEKAARENPAGSAEFRKMMTSP
jgi:hypothetical protein